VIPDVFTAGAYRLNAVKKYIPNSILVGKKIEEQYPCIHMNSKSTYFIELRDEVVS